MRLCCTNRSEDVFPLSADGFSLLPLRQVCQERCSGSGRRCGFGFLRPAVRTAIGRVVSYNASTDRQGYAEHDPQRFHFDAASAAASTPSSPQGAPQISLRIDRIPALVHCPAVHASIYARGDFQSLAFLRGGSEPRAPLVRTQWRAHGHLAPQLPSGICGCHMLRQQ